MARKKSGPRAKGQAKASSKETSIPDVYQEMLAEALPLQSDVVERPLKRRRTGRRDLKPAEKSINISSPAGSDNEGDLVFEDVLAHDDGPETPQKTQQTAYRDYEEDSESDYAWESVDLHTTHEAEEPSGDLELTLTKRPSPQRKTANRRKAVTKAEKDARLEIHKMHLLCLLSFVYRRNSWCDDAEVQKSLKPLLDKKTLMLLTPRSDLSQFAQAESLKRGLDQAATMWRTKFKITARGMRRALWADDEKHLQDVSNSFCHQVWIFRS